MNDYPKTIQNLKDELGKNYEMRSAKVAEMKEVNEDIQAKNSQLIETRGLLENTNQELAQVDEKLTETRALDDVNEDQIKEAEAEVRSFQDKIESLENETRKLEEELTTKTDEWRSLESELADLESAKQIKEEELRKIEVRNMENMENAKVIETKETRGFSIIDEVRNLAGETGRIQLDENTEFRSMNATGTPADGGNTVYTNHLGLIDYLWDKSILGRIQATTYNGVVGNLEIPIELTVPVAGVKGENEAAAQSGMTFGSMAITPQRVTVQVPVSNQLLGQSSVVNEAKVNDRIWKAVVKEINKIAISKIDTAAKEIDATVITSTAMKRSKARSLKTELGKNNIELEAPYFIGNTEVEAFLEDIKVDAGSGKFLLENGKMLGFDYIDSNLIATNFEDPDYVSPLYFGSFNHLHVAHFVNGSTGIDIIVDRVTRAGENMTVFTINMLVGFGIAHEQKSIAKLSKVKVG